MIGRYAGISAGNWPLDGNSNDISGNSNNGADSNMSYGMGRFGNSGAFNGISSRIALPNNASLRPTTPTIIVWYKGTQNDAGTFLQNWNNTSGKYYGFVLGSQGHCGRAIYAKGTGLADGDIKAAYTNAVIDDNVWHMIASTFNGTSIKIYLDGGLEATTSWTATLTYTATQYPMIGVRQDASANYAEYVSGAVDNILLLPYVMTDQDIRRWYAYSKGLL
jgi:hypothetical protein